MEFTKGEFLKVLLLFIERDGIFEFGGIIIVIILQETARWKKQRKIHFCFL